MSKKIKRSTVYETIDVTDMFSYFSRSEKDAVELIKKAFDKVPEEYRSEAEIEFRSSQVDYEDYYQLEVVIRYYREETDDEFNLRKARLKTAEKEAEERDRAMYEKLRKKFEDT
jgi:RNA-splicing ligase RtcB